ncbi:MAG: RNA polymerase sigma factor [Vulcanimicrobiaceae bacterium]
MQRPEAAARTTEFVKLLDEHRGILFKVARAYCREPVAREDLVQDIIVQLWRSFARYDGRTSFSTWMYRIAVNVAISFYRRETRLRHDLVPANASLLEMIAVTEEDFDDRAALVYELIDRLEPLDRALMILYLDDYPYATIAEILGITETNVATKIGRIKQRLKSGIAAPH